MAYLGQLRRTATEIVHGWACDYCGVNAESYGERNPPKEWRTSEKYTVNISPLYYVSSSLYCSKRCCAKYKGLPWPPPEEEKPHRSLDKGLGIG